MAAIAEFELDSPLMREASRAVPEVRVRGEAIFVQGENPKYLFWVEEGPVEAFESALEADPSVGEIAVLSTAGEPRYYRVTFSEEYSRYGSYAVTQEHDIVFLDTVLQDGTARVRALVPSRAALREYRQFFDGHDIPFTLVRLNGGEEATTDSPDVTDNQREALVLAYDRGYYDSPRRTTLEELAGDLGISRQAFADRLKRGTKRLVGQTLRGGAIT